MQRNVMIIFLSTKKETVLPVQKIMGELGPYTKTRVGVHDTVLENSTESALAMLELVGETEKHLDFEKRLNAIEGVDAKLNILEI